MKKFILSSLAALTACVTFGQAPEMFNYQAVARDNTGALIANQAVGVRISIHDSSTTGAIIYQETHSVTTNQYGLFTLSIGGGSVVTGTFSTIPWGRYGKFIQVEVDPAGGTNYTDMGTTQLLSVPYALYAASGPSTNITAFQPPGCQDLPNVTTAYAKVGDMGTFTKLHDSTLIEVYVQTILYVGNMGTATGVIFELRVDDIPTTFVNATALIRTAGDLPPAHVTGIFSGLATGTHTVSLWAKSVNGNASSAYWDPGCFNNFGTNSVLVKEYR